MKSKKILTIASLFIALALLAAFGIFRSSEPVRAQDTRFSITHLNVPETNVVNLVGTSSSNLREVNRDGTVASTHYIVPAGMALVVTDITANVHTAPNVLVPLYLRNFKNGNVRNIYSMQLRTDKFGYVTTKDHFSGGLVIGAADALQVQGNTFLEINASVLGYTVPVAEAPQ